MLLSRKAKAKEEKEQIKKAIIPPKNREKGAEIRSIAQFLLKKPKKTSKKHQENKPKNREKTKKTQKRA